MFGSHYNRSSSRGSERQDDEKAASDTERAIPPRVLTRAARLSTMTFGSVTGWLDKSTIGRPQLASVGTQSQLLDVPRPLFARERSGSDDRAPFRGDGRRDVSPPRPVRPMNAEPLGRLSGMGYGLGLR